MGKTSMFTFPMENDTVEFGPYPTATVRKMMKAGNNLLSHLSSEHGRWVAGLGRTAVSLKEQGLCKALLNWNALSTKDKSLAISGDDGGRIVYTKKVKKELRKLLKGFDRYF